MTDFSTSLFAKPSHGRRVLICVRGNCAHPDFGEALQRHLQKRIEQHGLDDPAHPHYTTCNTTYCLGVCEHGPIMIVHPERVRYGRVDQAKLDRIFEEHLLQDQPVDELILPYPQPRKIG
jgi:(2Fe-2S) ferredoxin